MRFMVMSISFTEAMFWDKTGLSVRNKNPGAAFYSIAPPSNGRLSQPQRFCSPRVPIALPTDWSPAAVVGGKSELEKTVTECPGPGGCGENLLKPESAGQGMPVGEISKLE